MRQADVLVLGAGPAGTATAICCANAGLKVFMAERVATPASRPGETLHPGIEPLLNQLGVWEEFQAGNWLRHEGHWVQQGEHTHFNAFGSDATGAWRGFQAERSALDALLLRRAVQTGVCPLLSCRLVEPIRQEGRVTGVRTSEGTLLARYVVDATGGAQWLARRLGLATSVCSPDLRARYGYVTGELPERDAAPLWRGDAAGWTWTARVHSALYHWTRLWFDAREERRTPRDWLPEEYRHLTPQNRARGVDVTWRRADVPAGPGYFLTGDAAFLLDPAASHGVLKALMSGMMTAQAITRVVQHGLHESDAQRAYTLWLHRWFAVDAAKLTATYRLLRAEWGAEPESHQG